VEGRVRRASTHSLTTFSTLVLLYIGPYSNANKKLGKNEKIQKFFEKNIWRKPKN
jgi:hypothetical protein